MERLLVRPSALCGQAALPPSKSQTLRALLFASLAKGRSRIRNPLASPDAEAMLKACRSLGAEIERRGEELELLGTGGELNGSKRLVDAGNSGIVLRFISAVAALGKEACLVTGDRSLCSQRPMRPLLSGLAQLGAEAFSIGEEGFAPLIVRGPLRPGKVCLLGSDSQHVSALLIAAQFVSGRVELEVEEPGEGPWVDLTLSWFDRLGLPYKRRGYASYLIEGKNSFQGFDYRVPGDLSSASFPVAAALVTGSELELCGVDLTDPQGDKELFGVFEAMGARFRYGEGRLRVQQGASLRGVEVDINRMIDAIAILPVVACFAKGVTRIFNGAVARQKECDRIRAISRELNKMGARIEEREDGLLIEGGGLKGAALSSHGDHRIAMSLAVAALGAEGESSIEETACIAKSYPSFLEAFRQLGADMEMKR